MIERLADRAAHRRGRVELRAAPRADGALEPPGRRGGRPVHRPLPQPGRQRRHRRLPDRGHRRPTCRAGSSRRCSSCRCRRCRWRRCSPAWLLSTLGGRAARSSCSALVRAGVALIPTLSARRALGAAPGRVAAARGRGRAPSRPADRPARVDRDHGPHSRRPHRPLPRDPARARLLRPRGGGELVALGMRKGRATYFASRSAADGAGRPGHRRGDVLRLQAGAGGQAHPGRRGTRSSLAETVAARSRAASTRRTADCSATRPSPRPRSPRLPS